MTRNSAIIGLSDGRSSRFFRFLGVIERILASPTTQLVCFAVVAQKLLRTAGLGFGEFLPLLIVYIGLTHRIERIEKAVAPRTECDQ